VRTVSKAGIDSDLCNRAGAISQKPSPIFQTQASLERSGPDTKRGMEYPFQLTATNTHIAGDGIDGGRGIETLLNELSRLSHTNVMDSIKIGVEVGLWHRSRTYILQHHMPDCLLSLVAAAMTRNQIKPKVDCSRRTGTGDKVTLINKQPIHSRFDLGEAFSKRVQHIPVHTYLSVTYEARLSDKEGPGTDPDETDAACGRFPKII